MLFDVVLNMPSEMIEVRMTERKSVAQVRHGT